MAWFTLPDHPNPGAHIHAPPPPPTGPSNRDDIHIITPEEERANSKKEEEAHGKEKTKKEGANELMVGVGKTLVSLVGILG